MGFLGLGSGIKWPCFISLGCSPVSAAIFSISAISSFISMGPALTSSTGKLSGPVLFPFLNLSTHFVISSAVKGFSNFTGGTSKKGVTFSTQNSDSKKVVTISVFCSGSVTISSFSLFTRTMFFSFLFRSLIAS